jgi:RNA polymerase sigma-70 factor (ECF subfamily)
MTLTPEDARTDRELLTAHVDGDAAAFAEIVRRHQDQLWGVALRTLSHPEDAADALQDALLKAHRGAAAFRGDAAVMTWLHRIVVNACLDRLRRDLRRPADATEPDRLERYGDNEAPTSGGADTAADRLGDDVTLRLDVEAALATLAPEQRAALVLVDVLGHDIDTAASILGCLPGTVKSRCSRGRARLAPLLAHLRGPEDQPAGNRDARATVEPAEPAHRFTRTVAPEGGEQP